MHSKNKNTNLKEPNIKFKRLLSNHIKYNMPELQSPFDKIIIEGKRRLRGEVMEQVA